MGAVWKLPTFNGFYPSWMTAKSLKAFRASWSAFSAVAYLSWNSCNIWELPKVRCPNRDPKIVGLCLQGHP